MANLHRQALLGQMTQMGRPPRSSTQAGGPRSKKSRRDYTPSSWEDYFDSKEDIQVGQSNVFRVYKKGTEGAVVLLLHGGGLSALSFSVLTSELTQQCLCRVVAVDLRGHGDTHTDDDYSLSMETLISDVVGIVEALYGDDPPPIVLMGHSLGGALAVRVAHSKSLPSLAGLIVIDVVEGTAMESLSAMQAFLRGQPKRFPSLHAAIEWACRTGQIRNTESARISMPPRLRPVATSGEATASMSTAPGHRAPGQQPQQGLQDISEGGDSEESDSASASAASPASAAAAMGPPDISPQAVQSSGYVWRIDLTKTEPFWEGWFKGLTSYFLNSGIPSYLLLAGVDRLDKEMTIAHMQGKFQMQVLQQVGHCIHEDAPDKVGEAVSSFLIRYRLAKASPDAKPKQPFLPMDCMMPP